MRKSERPSGLSDATTGESIVPAEPARAGWSPPSRPAVAAAELIQRFKLLITGQEGVSGERRYTVSGETYPFRDGFRELGGKWNGLRQRWEFKGEDPSAAIAAWLAANGEAAYARYVTSRAPAQAGLADVSQPDLDTLPHYIGHRSRLRERLLSGGDDALPDYELLELLLFYAVRIRDTKPLAKALLAEFGTLSRLVNADLERFERFAARAAAADLPPVDQKMVVLFRAVRALASRLAREEVPIGTELTNWDKLIAYLRATMGHRPVEQFRLLFLDRRNILIADEKQNEGSIDHTPVYPREVVKRALTLDASALIMVHNHPSNHPQPSRGDIDMTQVVQKALKAVGVVLHDHVIISGKGHSSFRQMGLL